MKGRTWRGEEPARISVPSHLGHQGQTRRSVAHGHSRKSLGRVHVCGTEEHCRPHSEERRRVGLAASKIWALFQHSETYTLLCICHMVLLCGSTCVVAAQCRVKRARGRRSAAVGKWHRPWYLGSGWQLEMLHFCLAEVKFALSCLFARVKASLPGAWEALVCISSP